MPTKRDSGDREEGGSSPQQQPRHSNKGEVMKRRRVEEGSGRLDQATVMSFFQPKKKIKQQQQQKNAHAEEMSTKKIEAKQEKAKDMAMGDSEMIQIEPTSPIANAAKIEQQAEARPELTDIDADIDEASDNGLELKHLEGISAIKATDTEMGPLLPTIDGSSSKIPAQLSQRSDSAKNPSSLARTGVLMRQQSTFQDTLEALEGSDSATAGTKQQTEILWNRQPVPPEIAQKSNSHPLIFQQMKIDEYQDSVTGKLQARLYGITEQGNSVTCFVEGFYPYFYVPSPPGFDTARIEEVVRNINRAVEGAERSRGEANAVRRIDIVLKESIYGYHGGVKSKFWRIEVKYPYLISVVKGVLERRGVAVPGVPGEYRVEQVYESSLEYTLRFMIDHNIVGANWIELPAGKYRYRERAATRAQIEVEVDHRDIVSYEPLNEWAKVAPLRILSFDIECAGRKGVFPEANVDPVIQIANMVTIHGEAKPFIRNIFTLNTCASIVGSQILSYDREEDLLLAWGDFITKVDPDIIIGYNISNFDLPYLLDRASALKVDRFAYLLGRVKDVKSVVKDSRFSSKAYGTRDNKVVNMDGRVQFDVLQAMRRDYGLRSFSLNAVSAQFLGEQKEDVPHSIITELQNGNEETRRRLAVYCLKDAYLPQRLVDKLMLLVNYMEMARVTGVPFNYLLARGQQIKVVSQLYRKAIQQDLIIPTIEQRGGAGSGEDQYEGATVIEPKRGFYDVPIATLDFASLYPSIMMAHNLCYTTLLNERVIKELGLVKDKDYEVTPTGDAFVRAEVHKGLLPEVLRELLSARKKAKTDMKKELDPFKVKVLNGRQLALKISANSVYGFTGATIGRLPCLQISASTTAYGREMIEATRASVEKQYSKANGYEHDAEVIYGDTDSVMVKFGTSDLREVMQLGQTAAEFVTKQFIQPIKLEFEKVYFPYLLINKKRYAGLYWTRPEKYDKLDAKGLEMVRRDNCPLVPTVIETCLRKMLIDRDVDGAMGYVKEVISDLLQNKVDLSQLVITKQLSRTDYAAKQAHVELAERMRQRDAGSAPQLGDRVPYVIIQAGKGAKAYERAEDPIYVLENNIPIDNRYYLENQLTKPLQRIFEPILGSRVESLFNGSHTRTIHVNAPSKGGLMNFVVKTKTCLGCRTPLSKSSGDKAVCKHCEPRLGAIYLRQKDTMNELEERFAQLWTQCQRCQGSLCHDVVCGNRDCPIFYMRKKVQKDLDEQAKVMERFEGYYDIANGW